MAQEPVLVVIRVEGGIVQGVVSAGVPVEFVAIDYDTDDAQADELLNVPQASGKTAKATYWGGMAEIDGPWCLKVYEVVRAFNEGRDR